MTISQAMSNAASGLAVATRASTNVSTNVANALDPHYARREIEVSNVILGATGTGARVVGVTRVIDVAVLADRRVADAHAAASQVRTKALSSIEDAVGSSDSQSSLTGRMAAMEAAIVVAASLPQSESRLDTVLTAAKGLASQINGIASGVQGLRADADASIARDVETVNRSLSQIGDLNKIIFSQTAGGRDVNDLLDQRQELIDNIAAIIPIREIAREGGRVAIYTTAGMALLDGRAAVLGFTQAPAVDATMTKGNGLSGLTLDGRAVDSTSATGAVAGGRLAASFALRDETGVALQGDIDAIARNLVERFSDPATDATLAGNVGLFTDEGGAFSPVNETGLASRISINPRVDPDQGGALWRLRDGIGAMLPGQSGDAGGLTALLSGLTRAVTPASGSAPVKSDAAAMASAFLSSLSTSRLSSDTETTFLTVRADTLRMRELENGVSQDDEMQKLLLIEKAYAANAKVFQVVDTMLQTLLEI